MKPRNVGVERRDGVIDRRPLRHDETDVVLRASFVITNDFLRGDAAGRHRASHRRHHEAIGEPERFVRERREQTLHGFDRGRHLAPDLRRDDLKRADPFVQIRQRSFGEGLVTSPLLQSRAFDGWHVRKRDVRRLVVVVRPRQMRQEPAVGRRRGRQRRLPAPESRGDDVRREKPEGSALDVALRAGDLTREIDARLALQLERAVEHPGRGDAMNVFR